MKVPIALAVLALLAAGPVQAQTAQAQTAAALRDAVFAPRYSQAPAERIPGVAKTAVDRRFAADGAVASFGFLCGLQEGADRKGAAAARGVDPTGRFVGAKLRFAFR